MPNFLKVPLLERGEVGTFPTVSAWLAGYVPEWSLWNYQRISNMRFFGSAVVALVVLLLVDHEFYDGRFWSVAVTLLRHIGRSIGLL
jgi:hypothetical protein